MEASEPRKTPCASCPYRKNVPSGIWHPSEYEKLRGYDGETYQQATRAFSCHQKDGTICAGWLGHRDPAELLAVRLGVSTGSLSAACINYTTEVPLHESGAAAAEHGLRELRDPGDRAVEMIRKIERKAHQ